MKVHYVTKPWKHSYCGCLVWVTLTDLKLGKVTEYPSKVTCKHCLRYLRRLGEI